MKELFRLSRVSRNSGLSAVSVAIIVVLVVIAGAAGTFAIGSIAIPAGTSSVWSSSGQNTATTTNAIRSTSESSPAQSLGQSLTESTSTHQSGFGFSPILSTKDLLGNFSEMKLQFSLSNGSSISNGTIGFAVLGQPTVENVQTVEVNYSLDFTSAGQGQNGNIIVYYATSNYSAILVNVGGQNLTGFEASIGDIGYTAFYGTLSSFESQYMNATMASGFRNQGTVSQSYGQLTLPVTTYSAADIVVNGSNVSNATVKIGEMSSGLSIVTYLNATGTENGQTETIMFEILSLSPISK